MENIYVKISDIELTKTRKSFLKKLITNKGVITYSDKECTIVQCDKKSAYRSVTDLHAIVCSRFKYTSLSAVVKIIKELIEETKGIVLVYCTQINKPVVRYSSPSEGKYVSDYSKSNYYKTKGVDGYSLEMFDKMISSLKKQFIKVEKSLFLRTLDTIKNKRERLLAGKVNCIPWNLPRFETQCPGIEKGKYYLCTANSKVTRI